MKISFNGAAQTVTGSQFLLEVNGKRLLIDCGLYQGRRAEAFERNRSFHFDPRTVDAAILSHAHIDHSGNLPSLVKDGYNRRIYATRATCDLADIMLRDSGHIQELDVKYVNQKRARRGEPHLEPLYTQEDAAQVVKYFAPVDYDQEFTPMEGVTARLVDAGHILGSSSVHLTVQEDGDVRQVWFSGDIGRKNLNLLRDPVYPQGIEFLVMESTYGDKLHEDPLLAYEELHQVLMSALQKHGKVIIPAFAVGRTQEIVFAINQFISDRRMPPVQVYVDSPLAVNASDIFRKHGECLDVETRQFIASHHHPALEFDHLTYIRSVEESKRLNTMKGPMIIIAASGMCESGRILHHLKNNIEDERNTILIVSWQAPYTLGRRLADREKRVRIFGEEYYRRAEVCTIGGLSAHAGQKALVEYACSTRDTLKQIFLVHGDPDAAYALMEKMAENGLGPSGSPRVSYPKPFEVAEL